MVAGQGSQVCLSEFQALLLQAAQVGSVAYLVGRQAFAVSPYICHISRRIGYHPLEHAAHFLNIVAYREDAAVLQVCIAIYLFGRDTSLGKPFCHRPSQVLGRIITKVSTHSIVETIRTHYPLVFSQRNHIYTYSRRKSDFPIVLWHTGDYVLMSQGPGGWNSGVLYPCILVTWRELDIMAAVLREDTRVCLDTQVHDSTLVVYEVLYGHGGTNHLARRAVVIELSIL